MCGINTFIIYGVTMCLVREVQQKFLFPTVCVIHKSADTRELEVNVIHRNFL